MNFRKRRPIELPAFQIAPMIDFVFQLLFFFVASQIFAQWEVSLDITLPTAEAGRGPGPPAGEIIINVFQDGRFVVNQQPLDAKGLGTLLGRIVDLFPGQPVLIRADKKTAYQHVIRVLDLCRKADIWNISFATNVSETR